VYGVIITPRRGRESTGRRKIKAMRLKRRFERVPYALLDAECCDWDLWKQEARIMRDTGLRMMVDGATRTLRGARGDDMVRCIDVNDRVWTWKGEALKYSFNRYPKYTTK